MSVASFSLCKELYKVSQWGDDSLVLHSGGYPLYDLGYLMRKLQPLEPDLTWCGPAIADSTGETQFANKWLVYATGYVNGFADTPEDAAVKLAIKMFKSGLLKKEAA